MEQHSLLTPTIPETQLPAEHAARRSRWMQHFFCDTLSPGKRSLVDLQRRAVWVGLALILQSLNIVDQGIGYIDTEWPAPLLVVFNSLLPLILLVASFIALGIALGPARLPQQEQSRHIAQRGPQLWQKTILILTLLLALVGSVVAAVALAMCFLPIEYANDGASLDTNAAILLLQGRDPYTASNIVDVAREFPIHADWTTPLRLGRFSGRLDYPDLQEFQAVMDQALKTGQAPELESRVSYPALAFLPFVPFALFKYYNVVPFYLLTYLAIAFVAWKAVQPALRPWAVLLAIANIPMLGLIVGLNIDLLYALLLLLAWLQLERRWTSALLLGLAIASKQTAWLFVPFYLIMIWRTLGWREALYRALIAGGTGIAINLPFIVWNAQAWLLGILTPVAEPMFPKGVGIITLSITHLLPYFPGWVYILLEGCIMLSMFVWYWRICRRYPEAALLFAIIPLLFAWRSLPSYFCCMAFPIFVLLAAQHRDVLMRRFAFQVK